MVNNLIRVFVGNLVLFAAVKKNKNRSRIDKVIAMVRMAPSFWPTDNTELKNVRRSDQSTPPAVWLCLQREMVKEEPTSCNSSNLSCRRQSAATRCLMSSNMSLRTTELRHCTTWNLDTPCRASYSPLQNYTTFPGPKVFLSEVFVTGLRLNTAGNNWRS